MQHLYPKSQIDVFITVLEDDGSSLAAAITCAGLAVADAAIDMFDVIVGASLVRFRKKAECYHHFVIGSCSASIQQ